MGNFSLVINVIQVGKDDIIYTQNVATAGTLLELLGTSEIRKLKLSGYINGTDVEAIRFMPLTEIDLSNVYIVQGGYYLGAYETFDNIFPAYFFNNNKQLESVKISNSVTEIGRHAFKGCENITSINIPESVMKIDDYAFSECTNLTTVNIPSNITDMGRYVFAFCTRLTSINIPENITKISSHTFLNCTSLTSISIPESVTEIDDYAFCFCTGLTSINIPRNIIKINGYAFYDCTMLKEVHVNSIIPPSITDSSFSTYNQATLYVPVGGKETYQNHHVWSKFATIIEEGEASIPIVGTWKTKTPNAGGYTEYFTFNSDKTGKSWEVSSDGIQGEEETFTYKIEDNKLIFSWKGGETYTSTFILSDNNLTIKDNATSTIFIRI